MHDEKRPLTDFYYPHNPRRKVFWTEDSRAYWTPNPESYERSRIKPRLSDNSELQGRDWLQELIDASRRRGMTVGAELSHTWVDKERTRGELADCVQQDIYGNRLDQQICFNNPDIRAYGIALYCDLAAHYDIDFIMTCVRGFQPGAHAARGCLGLFGRAAPHRHHARRLFLPALPSRCREAGYQLERSDDSPALDR